MDFEDRIQQAKNLLQNCTLCEFRCHVNRWEGQVGFCGADHQTYYLREFINYWEEVGSKPCYTILFNGCIFRCPYCILGNLIRTPKKGYKLKVEEFAKKAATIWTRDMEQISFLGGEPVIHLWNILSLLRSVPRGMRCTLHSYFYFTPEAGELLRGIFNLFLAEIRYGNDACAVRYSQAIRYTEIVRRNLLLLRETENLIIRHLLLPGHLECCYQPLVEWLAQNLPQVKLSIGNEYVPSYKASQYPELNRRVSDLEFRQAVDFAKERELSLIYRYVSPINPLLN